jgi:type II secretory pathway pseudopilin PulG
MRGYSVLEVLIATTIVAVGVGALAQLVGVAARANVRATQTTIATVLAQQKMEDLLSASAGDLSASPPGALVQSIDGYADFADRAGRILGRGPAPPAGSAYLRRWSIDPLPNGVNNTWILQVRLTDLRTQAVATVVAARTGGAF